LYARHFYAKYNERNGDDEARQRAGNADVKKCLLVDNNSLHLDNSPECSERGKGKRDKVWEGCRDTIFPAHKVVAHFVGKENRHNGSAIGSSSDKIRGNDSKDEKYYVNYYASNRSRSRWTWSKLTPPFIFASDMLLILTSVIVKLFRKDTRVCLEILRLALESLWA
jgi:hypothetical protein